MIKHAAERIWLPRLGEVEDVILSRRARGTTGSNVALARCGPARQSACRRHRQPLLLVGPADHRWRPSALVDKVPVMIAGGLESGVAVQGPPGGK